MMLLPLLKLMRKNRASAVTTFTASFFCSFSIIQTMISLSLIHISGGHWKNLSACARLPLYLTAKLPRQNFTF